MFIGSVGSPLDNVDTLVVEYAEGPPSHEHEFTPLPKKGDIPRPKTPNPHVFGHVLHQLWDNPPAVPWDPRLQHKRQFRELCRKGGQVSSLKHGDIQFSLHTCIGLEWLKDLTM